MRLLEDVVRFLGGARNRQVGSVEIQRTGCAGSGTFHDVKVDHGGFDTGMSQKRLDRADVGAGLK